MVPPSAAASSPLLAPWRSAPGRAGVFVDFDGTLAPIVTDPQTSRPLPGATEALAVLAQRMATVAIVSGRPAAFLVAYVAVPGVVLSGQYGLETVGRDQVIEHPDATRWRSVVEAVVERARAEAPPGVGVEAKGLALTIHVRNAPEHDGWARDWTAHAGRGSGLLVHRARRSYELRPPVVTDKGTVVAGLGAGLEAVCFVGDDLGDLPAFAALDRMAGSGVQTVRVAVVSDETPAELLAAADLTLEGPAGVRDFLVALAGDDPDPSTPQRS